MKYYPDLIDLIYLMISSDAITKTANVLKTDIHEKRWILCFEHGSSRC